MYKRGWIFQDWGIRAILAGQKTMTRRIQGLEYINKEPDNWELISPETIPYVMGATFRSKQDASIVNMKCPYQVGDVLWLRETFWKIPTPSFKDLKEGADTWPEVEYCERDNYDGYKEWGWKRQGGIFMPQRASRIDVEITGIKPPERVQDIPEEDAIKEGCEIGHGLDDSSPFFARGDFKNKWNSINGPGAWRRNDWVWPYEFSLITLIGG